MVLAKNRCHAFVIVLLLRSQGCHRIEVRVIVVVRVVHSFRGGGRRMVGMLICRGERKESEG